MTNLDIWHWEFICHLPFDIRILGLGDFAGLNTAGADKLSFGYSLEENFDSLEVGQVTAESFSGNFRTGAAFTPDHTAPDVLIAGARTFSTNNTGFGHFAFL